MFNKKNVTSDNTSENSYFHTMQDDLQNPAGKNSSYAHATTPELANSQPAEKKDVTPAKTFSDSNSPFLADAPVTTTPAAITPAATTTAPIKPLEQPAPANLPTAAPNVVLPPKNEPLRITEVPTQTKTDTKQVSNTVKVMIIILVVIIVGVLLGGSYFFIMTRQTTTPATQTELPVVENNATEQPIAEEETVNINPASEKYSAENPNIISLDLDAVTDQDIKNLLTQRAAEVAGLQIKKPLEFILTDKNNTPIAFPIFALAAKINLSQEVLANLEEKFSLYIFSENSTARLGLAVNLKNKELVLTKLLAQEKTLPQDLSLLFLENKPDLTTNPLFKDGKYNNVSVRYLNLNSAGTLSIDYAFSNNQLLLGTSKNTLRAIIDKTAPNTAQTTSNTPAVAAPTKSTPAAPAAATKTSTDPTDPNPNPSPASPTSTGGMPTAPTTPTDLPAAPPSIPQP